MLGAASMRGVPSFAIDLCVRGISGHSIREASFPVITQADIAPSGHSISQNLLPPSARTSLRHSVACGQF
jgi:hypothetical protein